MVVCLRKCSRNGELKDHSLKPNGKLLSSDCMARFFFFFLSVKIAYEMRPLSDERSNGAHVHECMTWRSMEKFSGKADSLELHQLCLIRYFVNRKCLCSSFYFSMAADFSSHCSTV